jgi:hypothetical protein
VTHTCAQPLRIEPATFFIKGPFWRGALLFITTVTSTLFGGILLLALLRGDTPTDASSVLWRLFVWIAPPVAHFIILKTFVEGKPPHYGEDRIRWLLRLRVSLDAAWPSVFPLLPRLTPEAECEHAMRHTPRVLGRQKRYFNSRRWAATHPLLQLEQP